MSFPKFDTANRICTGDTLLIDGKKYPIADVFDAGTRNKPGMLAFLLIDPAGSLTSGMHLVFMEGGYIADFVPNMAYRANLVGWRAQQIRVRRRGLGFEVYCEVEGGWEYLGRDKVRHLTDWQPVNVDYHLAALAEQTLAVAA